MLFLFSFYLITVFLFFLHFQVVSHIQGSIEVVPQLLNKGVIVKSFMSRLLKKRAGRLPVLTLIIGDEQCDDMMFEVRYILYYTVLHCTVPYCVLLAPTSPPSSSWTNHAGNVPDDWWDVTRGRTQRTKNFYCLCGAKSNACWFLRLGCQGKRCQNSFFVPGRGEDRGGEERRINSWGKEQKREWKRGKKIKQYDVHDGGQYFNEPKWIVWH